MPIYTLDAVAPDLPPAGTYWLAPDAHIMGKVRLGRDVGVWFGCVMRGDNEWIEIGEGSNVQEHCMLHTDMGFPLRVGRGCTLGHRATLHGCIVGENSLIGMGATILNGAKIGRNSIVGAGALVTEGKEFPDNSLIVGTPARAIRTLDDAAVERLKASADNYIANWKRFAAGLKQIG